MPFRARRPEGDGASEARLGLLLPGLHVERYTLMHPEFRQLRTPRQRFAGGRLGPSARGDDVAARDVPTERDGVG